MDGVAAPAGVTVRPLTPADVDAVAALEAEAFSSPWSRDTFLGLMDRRALELRVLESAEAGIVGYAVLWCILDQGELANMAVAPAFRGRGFGAFLLSQVLEVARERGVKTLFLEVRVSNEAAARLYGRFGFEEIGVRRGYYDRPKEDALVMRATLG